MKACSVYKFGGASIKDAEAVRNMFQIVQAAHLPHLVIVVSAMGKTTNALELLLQQLYGKQANAKAAATFGHIQDYHRQIAQQLFAAEHTVFGSLQALFCEMQQLMDKINSYASYNQAYDALVCYGELLSSTLLVAYFNAQSADCQWEDARSVIRTNNQFRHAKVEVDISYAQIRAAFSKPLCYITQGFIAGTADGHSTTLGREGSDYTAALIAAALSAHKLCIWKDVDGVCTADPHLFSKARVLPQLSYKEAVEMAQFGAGVIHPKTMTPLRAQSIPLQLRSFLRPQEKGSVVNAQDTPMPLCLIVKRQLCLLSLSPRDFSVLDEQQKHEVYDILYQHGCVVHLSQQLALSLSVCVDMGMVDKQAVIAALQQRFELRYNSAQMLISMRHYSSEQVEALMPLPIKMEQRDRRNYHFVIEDDAAAEKVLQKLDTLL